MHQGPEKIVVSRNSTLKQNQKNTGCSVVTYRPHFLSSLSFIEFQTVKFEHLSSLFCSSIASFGSSNMSFQVILSSGLAEFEF